MRLELRLQERGRWDTRLEGESDGSIVWFFVGVQLIELICHTIIITYYE